MDKETKENIFFTIIGLTQLLRDNPAECPKDNTLSENLRFLAKLLENGVQKTIHKIPQK